MPRPSKTKTHIWLYKFLLGTLTKKEFRQLREELEHRHIDLDPLERRIWVASKMYPDDRSACRDHIRREIDLWDSRTN